jgi:hypothetical protein
MWKTIPIIMLAACTVSKAKTLRLGDEVEFKFAGRNLFYSEACTNRGVVRDFSTYSDDTRYLIHIQCALDARSFSEYVWIDEEDITKVLKGPNPLK